MLREAARVDTAAFLPDDAASCDHALAVGRSLFETAPKSRLARALSRLADDAVTAGTAARGR
jgi:Flp pilus assembly CpaE family ATPase